MQSSPLIDLVVDALEEVKASDIVVLDVQKLTAMTDFMVIATGRSNRQVSALAENLIMRAKRAGHPALGVEGMAEGEWVLIDMNEVIVHVMQPDTRAFYQLEKLWGGREADLKTSTNEA